VPSPRAASSSARPRDPLAAAAKALLDRIAAWPRAAGSASERRAREACAARLQSAGFSVREAPFPYSAFPGKWATPLAGLMVLATVALAGHQGFHGSPRRALVAMLLGLVGIGALARWSATRGVLDSRLMQRKGVNLVATRGVGWPRVWLVAHLDSKSQPVPIGLRAAAIVLGSLACVALVGLALAGVAGSAGTSAGSPSWIVATIAGVLAALPIIMTTVGDHSPGAVDNASGVVSVMLAAESLPPAVDVGVLLTSAEELGLAGARAWLRMAERARSRVRIDAGAPPSLAINCDGVDDVGRLTVMRARRAKGLAATLEKAALDEGVHARIRGLIPGVLVDAVAFTDAGWDAVTVSRGTVATLLRIHRPSDTAATFTGEGMAEAARVMARAATVLAQGR
jgi:Peptidase family M28